MPKINGSINPFYWIYKIGFFIILALPILAWPPYFFPADWGKTLVFRSILAILLFLFIWQFLYRRSKLELPNLKNNKIAWTLAALFGVFLLAAIFSVDTSFSFWGSPYRGGGFIDFAFYFVFVFLAFAILKKEDWKKVFNFSIIVGVLVSLLGIIQYYGLFNKVFLASPTRPPSTMGNPDLLALYILLLFFVTLVYAIKENKIWLRASYLAALAIFIFTILITGSRAAYLGLAAGGIYFLLFYPKKIKTFKVTIACLLVLAAGAIFYINTTSHYPKFLEQNRLFNSISARLSVKNSLEDPRYAVWQIGLNIIKSRPLLGYGPENFSVGFDRFYNPLIPYITSDISWYDKAHNLILQTGAEAGVLGIIAYLALFVVLFWQLQKTKRTAGDEYIKIIITGVQATLIGYFVADFFGFDSFGTYIIFFLLIGYSMSIIYKENIAPKEIIQKDKFWKSATVFILFCILVLFLWQYNLAPLQINAEINKGNSLSAQKMCDQAFSTLDRVLPQRGILDSYIRLEYVEDERTCSAAYPDKNLAYTEKSVELLSEAVKIQPLYTRYWLFLGDVTTTLAEQADNTEAKTNLLEEANSYFDVGLKLAPKHQELLIGKAKTEMAAGNYSDTKNYAEKCISTNPNLSDCYWYLGLADIYLKSPAEADKNIKTATVKGYNVASEASLVELGNAYNSIPDYKNLAPVFEKLILVNPNAVQYKSALALIYKNLGEYQKARQEALMVLQISPQSKANVDSFLETLPY